MPASLTNSPVTAASTHFTYDLPGYGIVGIAFPLGAMHPKYSDGPCQQPMGTIWRGAGPHRTLTVGDGFWT